MPNNSAEFKFPAGTIRQINGKRYILKNSRWQRLEAADELENQRSQAEDKQEKVDREQLAADLEKQRPYTAKAVGNSVQIKIASKTIQLEDFQLEQNPVEINLIDQEISISPSTTTLKYKDGRPPATLQTPGVNFTPQSYPSLPTEPKQIDIHEYLYGAGQIPGILKRADGKYAQFADQEPEQLPLQEAIDYLAQKTNLDTDAWKDGQGIVQLSNFTVAAAKGALLQDIRDTLDRSITAGESMQQFIDRFAKVTTRWVGRSAWRAQLIYDQNIRQAYGAGRLQQMRETLDTRPYWQWRHGNSPEPRPDHLRLDGKIFKAEDVTAFPPIGFNCRCQVFAMSQRDFERNGGKLSVFDLEPDEGFLGRDDMEARIEQLKLDKVIKSMIAKELAF